MQKEFIEYKGYWIKVANKEFTIREEIAPGKFKTRRTSNCNQYTGKRDTFGNKLYTPFENDEEAMDRAKNYIDNHIVPYTQTPTYGIYHNTKQL